MPSFITLTAHTEAPGSLLIPSSSSSSGWMSVCPSPDSCAMLIIFSLPLLNFSCLTLIRSILTSSNREKQIVDGPWRTLWRCRREIICRIVPYSELYVLDWILHIIVLWNVYFLNLKVTLMLSICTQIYVSKWMWIYGLNLLSRLWIWIFAC